MAGMYEKDQVLKVADVGDSIFVAESDKTPVSRLLKRGKRPEQMTVSWPVEKYPTRGFKGTPDGTDKSSFSKVTRDPLSVYAQWLLSPGWMVSKLANLTNAHGVGRNERAHQAAKDALLLARMCEQLLLSNQDCQIEAEPSQPYETRGILQWLSPTEQATLPVPEKYRPSAACVFSDALDAFLPSSMEAMLEAAANEKKAPVDLTGFTGIKLKSRMSTWAQRDTTVTATNQNLASFTLNASEKKLINVVDFFEFDAGNVKTIPSWYLATDPETGETTDYTTRSGAFIDLSMWELRFLQAPQSYVESPKSGGPRGYHDMVLALAGLNPLGQCMVLSNKDDT